jgi:HlyD family secretion protein
MKLADPLTEIHHLPEVAPHKPGSAKKWLLAGAILAIAVAISVIMWHRNSNKVEYLTVRLDRGDIEATVNTTGNLNAVISVQVGSQVSGNILALYADFNTKVKKGQVVALIDPALFQAAVDNASATLKAARAGVVTAQATLAQSRANFSSAEANVATQKANVVKAQSAIDLAKVENDRRKVLVTTGSTSQEDADTAQATYDQSVASMSATQAAVTAAEAAADAALKGVDVAQTQLDQAKAVVQEDQATLAQAQLNLDHTKIIAPVDGTVVSRNMDVGQTVAASFQAPTIFLIAQDLTKMQVDTNVDESDVGRTKLDQPADFTVDAWPGQVFHGRVAQVRKAPINVQNVITYDVVIEVANPDLKLFPGMTANATIFTGRAANALRLPKAALRFHPRATPGTYNQGTSTKGAPAQAGMQTIYLLGPKEQPKPLRVKTGLSDANYVELVGTDLKEGDAVVVGMAGQPAGPQPQSTGGKKLGF